MTFQVPRRNQGQIVEVAFAAHDGVVYMRVHDRSDRTTQYSVSRMLADDEGDYWNGEPRNKRWRTITASQLPDAWKQSR